MRRPSLKKRLGRRPPAPTFQLYFDYILKWVLFSNEKSLGIVEIDDWKKESLFEQN